MIAVSARALKSKLPDWRQSAGPGYRALADRIRLLIIDGRLAPGTRLPAERELAAELGVSRTTIAAAYARLREDAFIQSLRGSGSVTRLPVREWGSIDPDEGLIDLSRAAMPPIPRLTEAMRTAVELLPSTLGDTGFDPIGRPELRQAIAARYTHRGLPTEPAQIMVTIGAQHAISLLTRTVLARGDRVLIEHPTYPNAIDTLAAAGGRLIPTAVDPEGHWDLPGLEQVVSKGSPALAYLMPDNHNPTGATLPTEQLSDALAIAAAHGTLVIIDETMGELTIDGEARLPAAAYGPAVLVGSVSKTVWGGVRVGWIRAEPAFIQKLVRARFASDLGTPVLEQLAVSTLLPDFDDILAERIAWLRAGRDHLLGELAARFPTWTVPVPRGGLTAWAGIGRAASSQLALAARAGGLAITAGPRFAVDGSFERFIRIPFSRGPEVTGRALAVLEDAWAAVRGDAVRVPDDAFTAVA